MSVYRLEKELGLGNSTVRGWRFSSPTIEKLKLVADYFEVSVDDLITEKASADTAKEDTHE